MIKRIIALLSIFVIFLAAGCGNSESTNASQETTAPSFPGEPYKLTTLPGTLYITDSYHVYATNSGYTEQMCAAQGIEKSKVDMYLPLSGYDMLIFPKNEPFANPNFKINVRAKNDKDYGIQNLKDQSDEEISAMANTLVSGFASTGSVSEPTIYKSSTATYIVFDWFPAGLSSQRRYATIINGTMVYFIGETPADSFTQEQDAQIREIVDTLTY